MTERRSRMKASSLDEARAPGERFSQPPACMQPSGGAASDPPVFLLGFKNPPDQVLWPLKLKESARKIQNTASVVCL